MKRGNVGKKLGLPWVKIPRREYAFVVGSRKVIKSVDTESKSGEHWYDTDIWSSSVERYRDLVPEGTVVYGELIGWTADGGPIQKGYTYNVPKGQAHLYIYRVAVQTPQGHLFDLPWAGVQAFAAERGLNVVPTLWHGRKFAFNPDEWIDIRFADQYVYDETVTDPIQDPRVGYKYPQALPLSDAKTVDEGVVVRAEGITPLALKAKSKQFLEYESARLDTGEVDLEADASQSAD